MDKMKISYHGEGDWCHICGKRESPLADIWYPKNAEHDTEDTQYIRICLNCVNKMKIVIQAGKNEKPFKYKVVEGEIESGDKVLHGVFFGIVMGFNKEKTKATVDFSNGAKEPNLVFMVPLNELKKVMEDQG